MRLRFGRWTGAMLIRNRSLAQTTGLVYLGYFAAAIFGTILVRKRIDAGVALVCLSDFLYAATGVLFYRLFRPVSGVLALVASAVCVLGCATDLLGRLHLKPVEVSPLVFFGPFCILLGVLIVRSKFLPRLLGWLLIVAGLGWVTFLIPGVAPHAKVVVFPLGFVAELVLMLWLLFKGVDEACWLKRSRDN